MRHKIGAFSLIEVVVAIGVVVAGVAVILALLPGLLRRTEEAADLQTALRLPDAVETRLREEMAGAFPGGMQNGVVLVADKEGTNVRRESQLNVPPTPAYFYIDVRSFSSGELAYQPGRPVLPLRVRVGWPYSAVKAAGNLDSTGNFQLVEFLVTLSP
ncbi:MAG: hypothetical protein H7A44_10775 [Opitutaceae bacterium]|nr:hypothetical protein [Cephaloticoccus sp.]MCP5530912.1 hypothetical protein [Opitutaceae bacterium]